MSNEGCLQWLGQIYLSVLFIDLDTYCKNKKDFHSIANMTDESLQKNISSVIKNELEVDFKENEDKKDDGQNNKEPSTKAGKTISLKLN